MSEPLNVFIDTGLDENLAKSYAAQSGLVQVLTNVSGKHGNYQRYQWVRPEDAVNQVFKQYSHHRDGNGKPIKPLFFPISECSQSHTSALTLDKVVNQYKRSKSREPLQAYIKKYYFISDGQSQTKDYYDRSGEYTTERKQLHKKIVDKLVSEAGEPKKGEKPVCILLGGGSASGKSTIRDIYVEPDLQENNIKVATVDSDAIKEELPEYDHFKEQDVESAAYRTHQESADITSEAINALISSGKNFIYDGTMKSYSKYKGIIDSLKEAGYSIRVVVADVPVSVALERSQKRAEKTGRKVPRSIIEGSHGGCAVTFPKIASLVDEFELYDNTGDTPVLIQDNEGVHDQKLYEAFSQKGQDYIDKKNKGGK